MKKLLIALSLLLSVSIIEVSAQTVPTVTPIENNNPIPYSSPQVLTSIEAYNFLINNAVDPVNAAWIVSHSDTATAGYLYLDQLIDKLTDYINGQKID